MVTDWDYIEKRESKQWIFEKHVAEQQELI